MKAIARIANSIEWVITFVVSYFLLQFGADRISRVITSRYIDGNLSNIDGWLTFLGATALVATFCLIHTTTRFYTAAILASVLGLSSLSALSGCSSPEMSTTSTRGVANFCIVAMAARMPPRRRSSVSLVASERPARTASSVSRSVRNAIHDGR